MTVVEKAAEQDIKLLVINSENYEEMVGELEASDAVIQDIKTAVGNGKEVTIPAQEVSIDGWTGSGYIIMDPDTGAGAYRISGGLNGGIITGLVTTEAILGTTLMLIDIGIMVSEMYSICCMAVIPGGLQIALLIQMTLLTVAIIELVRLIQLYVKFMNGDLEAGEQVVTETMIGAALNVVFSSIEWIVRKCAGALRTSWKNSKLYKKIKELFGDVADDIDPGSGDGDGPGNTDGDNTSGDGDVNGTPGGTGDTGGTGGTGDGNLAGSGGNSSGGNDGTGLSGDNSNTLYLVRLADDSIDGDLLNNMNEMKDKLPTWAKNMGNFGYSEVAIDGLDNTKFFAHSSIQNEIPSVKDSGISIKPESSPFTVLQVDGNNVINGEGAWLRDVDTEYKILSDIQSKLGDNYSVSGRIKLYTELQPCPSCLDVIKQFVNMYPNIDVEVIFSVAK